MTGQLGPEQMRRFLFLREKLFSAEQEKVAWAKSMVESLIQEKACLTIRQLAISGDDLYRAGVRPGKQMGQLLQQLLDAEEHCANTPSALLAWTQQLLSSESKN